MVVADSVPRSARPRQQYEASDARHALELPPADEDPSLGPGTRAKDRRGERMVAGTYPRLRTEHLDVFVLGLR
jgi:hypothetical protein